RHRLDEVATIEAQNRAAAQVSPAEAVALYKKNQPLVEGHRVLDDGKWQLLRAEKRAFLAQLGTKVYKAKAGLAGLVLLITGALTIYVYRYQQRIVRTHVRGTAIGALMASMLLLPQ